LLKDQKRIENALGLVASFDHSILVVEGGEPRKVRLEMWLWGTIQMPMLAV
jgi:hypothetical protein